MPVWEATVHTEVNTIVDLLLGYQDINPNFACRYGQTLLCRAAFSGHCYMIRELLKWDDINPNYLDCSG